MTTKKSAVELAAELQTAQAKINMLTQELAQRDAQYIELKAMYQVALEDIKRLMEQQATTTPAATALPTSFEELCESLEASPTNEAWKQIQFKVVGSEIRVWFTTTYYYTNKNTCKVLINKLANIAVLKGYLVSSKSSYLGISKRS